MTIKSRPTQLASRQSTARRLLRAIFCLGHPKLKPWMCLVFFVPQLILYLYWLGPVFVYYVKGVPPETSLEAITGIWRAEGGHHAFGYAPRYFVDTQSGSREVHCGFPMQRALCGDVILLGPRLWVGKRVTVHYDPYFGILAFENLDPPEKDSPVGHMTYASGVALYAQPSDTIMSNHGAHLRLPNLFAVYLIVVISCWQASGNSSKPPSPIGD